MEKAYGRGLGVLMPAKISLRQVSFEYPIYSGPQKSIKSIVDKAIVGCGLRMGKGRIEAIKAIDSISCEFNVGDRVALCGQNGAGKSTLLKLLSGRFRPTSGSIEISGSVASIIELGAGMDPELTGVENAERMLFLNGFSRKDSLLRVDQVLEFSELGEFFYLPVRTYSQGMMMRLMFSVLVSREADILLLDELFLVGDSGFQAKMKKRLESMMDSAKITIMSSHIESVITNYTSKTLTLAQGSVVSNG